MAKQTYPLQKLTAAVRHELTNQIRSFNSISEFWAALTPEMLTYLGCTEKSSQNERERGILEMCRVYNQKLIK